MSTRKADIAELDKWFPPRGPCAFCGHKDARHWLWDTFMACQWGGETVEEIAHDLEHSIEAVEAVLRIRPYRMRPLGPTKVPVCKQTTGPGHVYARRCIHCGRFEDTNE